MYRGSFLTKIIGILFSLPVIVSAVMSYRFLESDKLFPAVHSFALSLFFLYIVYFREDKYAVRAVYNG